MVADPCCRLIFTFFQLLFLNFLKLNLHLRLKLWSFLVSAGAGATGLGAPSVWATCFCCSKHEAIKTNGNLQEGWPVTPTAWRVWVSRRRRCPLATVAPWRAHASNICTTTYNKFTAKRRRLFSTLSLLASPIEGNHTRGGGGAAKLWRRVVGVGSVSALVSTVSVWKRVTVGFDDTNLIKLHFFFVFGFFGAADKSDAAVDFYKHFFLFFLSFICDNLQQ